MAIYYLVFAILMKQRTQNFVPFLLIGIVFWSWFSRSVQNSSQSIMQAKELIAQMNLPKAFFPIATVFQDSVKQLFVLIVLLIFLIVYGMPVSLPWAALPVLMALQLILITGFSILVAGIVPFFPDFKFIVTAGLQIVFFASGIFFNIDQMVIPVHRTYVYMNPMAGLIRNYRLILMQGQWPDWPYILFTFIFALVLLMLSGLFVHRLDHIYPKIVV